MSERPTWRRGRGLLLLLLIGIPAQVATAAPANGSRVLSREERTELQKIFWLAQPAPRIDALPAPRGSADPPLTPAVAVESCQVEVVAARPLGLADAAVARVFSVGVSAASLTPEERHQADTLLQAMIAWPAGVSVTTFDDIQALLALETARDLLGCNDVSCLAEIGGAIGADYLVQSSVGELGGRLVVSARIVEPTTAQVRAQVIVEAPSAGCLPIALRRAGTELVSGPR
jgi:hypothetical protein